MKSPLNYIVSITAGIITAGVMLYSGTVFAQTFCFPADGCTGTSTPPSYGQLLVGNSGGTYTLTATSSLGISGSFFSYPFPSNATSTELTFNTGTTTMVNGHYTGNLQVDGVFFAPVTLVNSGNFSVTGTLSVTGQTTLATSLSGLLKATSGVVSVASAGSDYENPLTFSWPLIRTTNAISFGGLATSSPLTAGLLYATGVNTMASVSTSTALSMSITGLAGTATALASDPSDCSANTWATTIAASGNLTCSAITYSGISSMTSANLFSIVSDETGGSGVLVGSLSPTFTGKAVFAAASTTDFSATHYFEMPVNQGAPTISGACQIDTTNEQLQCGNAGSTVVFDPIRFYSFGMSTTTMTGSSTAQVLPNFVRAGTIKNISCSVLPMGATMGVSLYYGTVPTYIGHIIASSTSGITTLSSSNTPTANATSTVVWGTPTGSPTSISCTSEYAITGT